MKSKYVRVKIEMILHLPEEVSGIDVDGAGEAGAKVPAAGMCQELLKFFQKKMPKAQRPVGFSDGHYRYSLYRPSR